jgi:hypothetical protein
MNVTLFWLLVFGTIAAQIAHSRKLGHEVLWFFGGIALAIVVIPMALIRKPREADPESHIGKVWAIVFLGMLGLGWLAVNSTTLTALRPLSASTANDLSEDAIPAMQQTYKANQARFFDTYKGLILSAELPVAGVTDPFEMGSYEVNFGSVTSGKSVWCRFVPKDAAIKLTAGETVHVRGRVADDIMNSIVLDGCTINSSAETVTPANTPMHHCTHGSFWDDGSGKCI